MKTKFFLRTLMTAILSVPGYFSDAQYSDRITGVYLTQEDFLANSLSMPARTDSKNHLKINLDHTVLLTRKGEIQKFSFGDIYGYFKDGAKFRSYGKKELFASYGYYQVVDESGLIIYSRITPGHRSEHKWYYYSATLNSPIHRLNPRDLRKDFKQNPEFVRLAIKAYKEKTLLTEMQINDLYNTTVKHEIH